jgi:extracellular factor (EF) 3-hydroxypalmitic acid methyl ester biosynthesis protein
LTASAIKGALPYVTEEDAELLSRRGTIADVADGKTILEEGSCRRQLLILLAGQVRVVRNHVGNPVTVATLKGPEPIGEIAYMDGRGASASVVADGPIRIFQIEAETLDSVLTSVPELGARVFQSLAKVLAQRLRAMTEILPSFVVNDVPQVRQVRAAPRPAESEATPFVAEVLGGFREKMLKAQTGLRSRKLDVEEIEALVASGCEDVRELLDGISRDDPALLPGVGAQAFLETFPFMMASTYIERCYMKPRGYAGDFETIEMTYRGVPSGSTAIGRMIDKWALSAGPAAAVRYRRKKIVDDIRSLVETRKGAEPLTVASLAVGPGREIFDVFEAMPAAPLRVVGIDIDDDALAFCSEEARKRSIGDEKLRLFQDNLVKLSLGRGRVSIPKQHFVYSMGLIDYLPGDIVVRLLNWAYDQLFSGGILAIGNFATGNAGKGFMDYVMDWALIHRTPDEMRDLFTRSKFGAAEVRIDTDPSGIQLFAYCQKT